ncbi:MAG: PQQ-binding-like beta-propeller repeat protein, partial [Planctomycetes bacterium]|nr:PQQ-binding-like beta-propeller repeat protein [Planctomycetota bacterium]
ALFQHHPLGSDEFATPYETQRIYELLAGRDVLAFFVGHGHAARAGDAGAWRWLMGGSTFGGNQGHGSCEVDGRHVRYVYDYLDPQKQRRVLLDEVQPPFAPFGLALAVEGADASAPIDALRLHVHVDGEGAPVLRELRAFVDFADVATASADADAMVLTVPVAGLLPGVHVVTVEVEREDGRVHHLLHEFEIAAPARESGDDARALRQIWSCRLLEAVQGPMAADGELLVVCGTAGTLSARDLATGAPRWQCALGGPAPGGAASDGAGGFFAGTLDGVLVHVDPDGEVDWRAGVGSAIAAVPFVHGDLVLAVDLDGRGHAFQRQSGRRRWQRPLAAYAIEKPPVLLDDRRALVGAWDTRVHAFALADGRESWSERGKGARAKAARYYSPADCPPVVQDGKTFVADRSFALMWTDLEGHELPGDMADVASVAGDPAAHRIYLRRSTGKVTCVDSRDLRVVWDRELPVGRTPTPVTAGGGWVFAIGERDGVLYVLDADSGEVVAQHRVNAGCYPFCPVLWRDGVAVVGG